MKLKSDNIKKVLIVTLSNLGDVVLTLPVFQAVAEQCPQSEIHVLVGQGSAVVFDGHPRVSKVYSYNKRVPWAEKVRLLSEIRRARYDLILDLRHSLFGLFGGSRYRNRYLQFLPKRTHKKNRHLACLRGLLRPPGESPFLWTDPAEEERLKGRFGVLKAGRYLAAAPGSKSDLKKWPAESYAQLLDLLAAEKGLPVVFVGDGPDAEDIRRVRSFMKTESLDLSGQTSFRELAVILKSASLVVTNDSAPLHVADAFGTPVLAVFGPTDPRKYGPRSERSAAIRKTLFCSPCERAQCRFHHECMKELPVREVYRAALRLLSRTASDREAIDHRSRRQTSPVRTQSGIRILVIRLDRVGDVVLSLPAIEAIRNRYPEAYISLMVRPYTRSAVEGHPHLDEVITYAYEKKGTHSGLRGAWRMIREVSARKFDLAVILHPSNRSHWIPFLAGIPMRAGLRSHGSYLLTHAVPDRRKEGLRHESEYALDVVRGCGIPVTGSEKCVIPVSEAARERARRCLEESPLIGVSAPKIAIHAGASCPSKRWPRERFGELGERILRETGRSIVIVGGEEDRALGRYLKGRFGDSCADLTGRLTLQELAAVLSGCECLVTNDSGPVHVAAAVGTRTLCVFGRNLPGLGPARWKALGEGHRHLHKDVGCAVCLAHRCPIEFECLKAVSVEEVYSELRAMLGERFSHAV